MKRFALFTFVLAVFCVCVSSAQMNLPGTGDQSDAGWLVTGVNISGFLLDNPGGTSATGVIATNIDDSTHGWKSVCVLPKCNPGGQNPPTSTFFLEQQSTTAPPGSSDTLSLLVSETVNAPYTNALWVWTGGTCDTCVTMASDFWIFPGPNIAQMQQIELDMYLFSSKKDDPVNGNNREYMWGLQWDQAGCGCWEIFNQGGSGNRWIHTGLTTPLTSAWHHIQVNNHRILTDTNNCGGVPCEYYDSLTLDGVLFVFNRSFPTSALPTGWSSSTGFQFQLNASGTVGSPFSVSEYINLANFSATN